MRSAAEYETKKYMRMRFAKTQKAIQDECVQLLQQYAAIKDELLAKNDEVKTVTEKLSNSELRLVEMTTYVRDLKDQIYKTEQQLSDLTVKKDAPEPPKFLRLDVNDRLGQAYDNNTKF